MLQLTSIAWRFSTDFPATFVPLISLISSPGCNVPENKIRGTYVEVKSPLKVISSFLFIIYSNIYTETPS